MKYSKDKYSFSHFEISHRKNKKYDAVLTNNKTGRYVYIPFGDLSYEHFHDKALGEYSDLNHYDPKRRKAYRARHKKDIDPNFYSAGNFAMKFLW
jgi:hypothetical protein